MFSMNKCPICRSLFDSASIDVRCVFGGWAPCVSILFRWMVDSFSVCVRWVLFDFGMLLLARFWLISFGFGSRGNPDVKTVCQFFGPFFQLCPMLIFLCI